jgi:hypothetical protein
MRKISKPLRRHVAVQLAAVALGAGVALASADRGSADPVYAASHCTHYAVTYWTSTPGNCALALEQMGVDTYQTTSFAWRDSNHIALNVERWWTLYLFDPWGGSYRYASAYGYGGATAGTGAAQTKALCAISSYFNASGECDTNWHD